MKMRGLKGATNGAVLAVLLAGCVGYQYALVEPAEHRQTITKQGSVVPVTPLEYQFADRKDVMALRIVNPSSEPVRLVAEKSYLVDPTGTTHPLQGGTIAPNAHIGMFSLPCR
jgi:hypothetical protein